METVTEARGVKCAQKCLLSGRPAFNSKRKTPFVEIGDRSGQCRAINHEIEQFAVLARGTPRKRQTLAIEIDDAIAALLTGIEELKSATVSQFVAWPRQFDRHNACNDEKADVIPRPKQRQLTCVFEIAALIDSESQDGPAVRLARRSDIVTINVMGSSGETVMPSVK